MNIKIDKYLEYTKTPWGRMFYEIAWAQIAMNKRQFNSVMDFGSGFGITANHFAKESTVTAVEPNMEMIERSIKENDYTQICGGSEILSDFNARSFDLIICHNVLEYHNNPLLLIKELNRLLCDNGIISIIVHSEVGKVMQAAVFENNPTRAYGLLLGTEQASSDLFGDIKLCRHDELSNMIAINELKINKIYGLRTFFGLIQNNDIKFDPDWHKQMLKLELSTSDIEPYKDISFYKHYIIRKIA